MAVKLLLLAVVATFITQTSAQKIWTIAVGHTWTRHSYFDDAGYLKGPTHQLIDLVCTQVKMDCRMVWDKSGNCWNGNQPGEHPIGGIGLMAGWYDACISFTPTTERVHVFSFGLPYAKPTTSAFTVKKGNPRGFNPLDLRGKKIGFRALSGSNIQCIARQDNIQGHILDKDQIKYYTSSETMFNAVVTGEVDAVFSGTNRFTVQHKEEVQRYGDEILCYLGGKSVMTRKDSNFIQHWNTGFQKLRQSNKWKDFCDKANAEHGHQGTLHCID